MREWMAPGQWDKGPEQYYTYPKPEIRFSGHNFVLTGVFALGARQAVEEQILELGGRVSKVPPKHGCYVVVGTLPSKEWVKTDTGRKLLTALELQQEGCFIHIVSEDHFVEALLKAQSEHTGAPIYYAPRKVEWTEHLAHWFEFIQEDMGLPLEVATRTSGYTVHVAGKTRQWLCRIHSSTVDNPIGIEPKGSPKEWVRLNKYLPEEVKAALHTAASDAATLFLKSQDTPKNNRTPLSPEELQRRNTDRKAAMRAKPVTQEVLDMADAIIKRLEPHLPNGVTVEGGDRAKYYTINLTPGNWLCRLHYKTKNKYVEIAGNKPTLVQNFVCDNALIESLIELITT